MKTVSIFRKSEAKRSEEEVKAATKFLARHQFELRFFRNKQRSRLEQLCRVMGAILVKPGAVLFEQGVSVR